MTAEEARKVTAEADMDKLIETLVEATIEEAHESIYCAARSGRGSAWFWGPSDVSNGLVRSVVRRLESEGYEVELDGRKIEIKWGVDRPMEPSNVSRIKEKMSKAKEVVRGLRDEIDRIWPE